MSNQGDPDSQLFNPVIAVNVSLTKNNGGALGLKQVSRSEWGMGLSPSRKPFTWQKKRRFLRIAKRYWPNVTICCAMTGISTPTFYTHRAADKLFAAKISQIEKAITEQVYAMNATEARNPKNFLDRAMYLRAHMPALYNPAKVVKIEGYKMTDQERRTRLAGLDDAVDAEIVKSYQSRRDKLEAKRQRDAEARGLSSDKQGVGGQAG